MGACVSAASCIVGDNMLQARKRVAYHACVNASLATQSTQRIACTHENSLKVAVDAHGRRRFFSATSAHACAHACWQRTCCRGWAQFLMLLWCDACACRRSMFCRGVVAVMRVLLRSAGSCVLCIFSLSRPATPQVTTRFHTHSLDSAACHPALTRRP